jgi:hypothetical protein
VSTTAQDWPRSTQVVEFQESLRGAVRPFDVGSSLPDRLECAVAAENVMVDVDDLNTLCGCVLQDLRIAVDVGAVDVGAVDVSTEMADGALPGVVRSGLVYVEGLPVLTVQRGEFELFARVAGDGRRLRYRLWLQDPGGSEWFLRGTKLVVNEASRRLLGRVWTETTTLYVVLIPLADDSPEPRPASYAGVVRVRPFDFLRQLGSLHGEPGPAGGIRAVGRLVSAFWSVIAEVYVRGGSMPAFAPGIEAAFGEPPQDR